jgi:hypothetical protein
MSGTPPAKAMASPKKAAAVTQRQVIASDVNSVDAGGRTPFPNPEYDHDIETRFSCPRN